MLLWNILLTFRSTISPFKWLCRGKFASVCSWLLQIFLEMCYITGEEIQKRPRVFSVLLCNFAPEIFRILVTTQLRRIIKIYLGQSTKSVRKEIMRSSYFCKKNKSNLDAAIQIFLCLRDPISSVFPAHCHVSPHSRSINICVVKRYLFISFSPSYIC